MTLPQEISSIAEAYASDGQLFEELKRLVSYQTESATAAGRIALKAYLEDVLVPALAELGCDTELHPHWNGGTNSFLVGTRFESEELPTVLCYGHADIVGGQDDGWDDDRSPWILDADGDRWYGRGTADNKGQHLINLAALRILLKSNGHLGFNLKFLFECGEEIGSPSLDEFSSVNKDKLAADVFIASDGPRLSADSPTIFLGSRGGITFELDVNLRSGSYHSGNWGGLLRNPGTTLAAAIGTLIDGHGRILLPELLPTNIPESVQTALSNIAIPHAPGDPHIDTDWADTGLTPAERLYGWNALEVLALGSGDIGAPIHAIPGSARAILQLRFVAGTPTDAVEDTIQAHLDRHGFEMVRVRQTTFFPASRLDPANPWVEWARRSIHSTTGIQPTVLPNIGGSLPNHVFEGILGLPTLWIPHSYPGCLQHAPNEHMLASIASQGLQIACGLFYDLGQTGVNAELPLSATTA
jgi:acetylornithine deacetylase/succinyl-diaminopimelate desuccinylase-like protein